MWTRASPVKHGLLAFMRPVFLDVCHLFIVVSNCIPGSAHSHAALDIWRKRSLAFIFFRTSPELTAFSSQSLSSKTACMNSSVTRTELLAFWYWTEWLSLPSRSISKPASHRARAFRSSMALHQMKSSTSG